MLTVGAFIVAQLQAWGVKRVYGVIGDAKGSELVNPDFSLLAQSCGGMGLKARTV